MHGETASGHWYVNVFFALPDGIAGWHCDESDEIDTVEDGERWFECISLHVEAATGAGLTYQEEHDERRGHDVLRVRLGD